MNTLRTYFSSFLLLTVFIGCMSASTYAQTKKSYRPKPPKQLKKQKELQFPAYFGISISPIFANNFLESKTAIGKDTSEQLTTTFTQKVGFSFGAALRFGLTKNIGIETGLYQIRRNFNVNMSAPDSLINGNKNLGFVSYDVPINALIYVKLTEKYYSSAALGTSISHYPTDVKDSIVSPTKHFLLIEGRRIHRTYFSANVGVGFELRTEKSGTIYVGGSAKIPLHPLMFGLGFVKQSGTSDRLVSLATVNGGFFSADLRYYLPTVKNKGEQLNKAIIE